MQKDQKLVLGLASVGPEEPRDLAVSTRRSLPELWMLAGNLGPGLDLRTEMEAAFVSRISSELPLVMSWYWKQSTLGPLVRMMSLGHSMSQCLGASMDDQ